MKNLVFVILVSLFLSGTVLADKPRNIQQRPVAQNNYRDCHNPNFNYYLIPVSRPYFFRYGFNIGYFTPRFNFFYNFGGFAFRLGR